jgi:hypothetical protein
MLFVLPLLHGCFGSGGGTSSSSTTSYVRLVNTTSDTLDLVASSTSNSTTSSTTLAAAVANRSASSYASQTAGTYTIQLVNSGTTVPSLITSYSFSSTVNYTLLAYSSGGKVYLNAFTDNQSTPTSGYGQIRIADFATDAGLLDVYMAVQGTSLANASALVSSISGTTGYYEIAKNTYHIWVTGAGDKTDLRLDLPSITLGDQQVLTLALSGTTGGVLVNGVLITQKGSVVAQTNNNARVRMVANLAASGSVTSANVNGVSLLGSGTSMTTSLGAYTLVPAGTMTATVNGAAACAGNTVAAGADVTLLYAGAVALPQCFLINDDNTLPSSGYTKLRVLNGVNGLAGNISLTYNSQIVASNVAFGAASTAKFVTSNVASSSLAVTPASVFSTTNLYLTSRGVYTLFLLGDSPASILGFVNQDH